MSTKLWTSTKEIMQKQAVAIIVLEGVLAWSESNAGVELGITVGAGAKSGQLFWIVIGIVDNCFFRTEKAWTCIKEIV